MFTCVPFRSGCISSLTVSEVALPHFRLLCNLGILLDSLLLFKDQVEALPKRTLAQGPLMCQLCPSLDQETLQMVTHVLVISQLDLCNCGHLVKRGKSYILLLWYWVSFSFQTLRLNVICELAPQRQEMKILFCFHRFSFAWQLNHKNILILYDQRPCD